jgi:predicted metalloprotease
VKWRRKKSKDVIDKRGAGPAPRSSGGGLPIPGGLALPGGAAGVIIVLVVLGIQFFGGGGGESFQLPDAFSPQAQAPGQAGADPIPPSQDPQRDVKNFSTYVFVDAQKTWKGTFESGGDGYQDAKLVLYDRAVNTGGCGHATSAVGPFYCPADQRVYLDLTFYDDMANQLGAPGDFAWAYVIAHEMGHHVQQLTGTSSQVERLSGSDPGEANELSVRLELQADCYAGVWANSVYAEGDLEAGDLDEAFTATEAIGDDRLQTQAGGQVDPDSFTHGTSEQRRTWFERGYESGDPGACDTFSVDEV